VAESGDRQSQPQDERGRNSDCPDRAAAEVAGDRNRVEAEEEEDEPSE
jgi:hypothetical protein